MIDPTKGGSDGTAKVVNRPVEAIRKNPVVDQAVKSREANETPKPGQADAVERPAEQKPLDEGELENVAKSVNQMLGELRLDVSLRYTVDEATERFVVTMVDGEGEEIRQFPPEEFLSMAQRLKELSKQLAGGPSITGVLVDERK